MNALIFFFLSFFFLYVLNNSVNENFINIYGPNFTLFLRCVLLVAIIITFLCGLGGFILYEIHV